MKRLYIQYGPDANSLAKLIALQKVSLAPNSRARPVPSQQLHLTIIHFGKIDEIFMLLTAHNPTLGKTNYEIALRSFANECVAVMPAYFLVRPKRYALYGEHGRTLVLEVEADEAVSMIHAKCLTYLRKFLAACDLPNVDTFMEQDPNFKHALTFHSHITLLKGATVLPNELILKDTLHLSAMPVGYD